MLVLCHFNIKYLCNQMSDWNDFFSSGIFSTRASTYWIYKEIQAYDLAIWATLRAWLPQAFLAFWSCPQNHVVFFMIDCFDVHCMILEYTLIWYTWKGPLKVWMSFWHSQFTCIALPLTRHCSASVKSPMIFMIDCFDVHCMILEYTYP